MPAPPPLLSLLLLGRRCHRRLPPLAPVPLRTLCATATTTTTTISGAPGGGLLTRRAVPADLPALRRLQPDAHGGLDDLPRQLLRLSTTTTSGAAMATGGFPRFAYVAEQACGDADTDVGLAAFLNVVLVDSGESAVLTHGRARSDLVGTGALAGLASAALADLAGRRPAITRSLGALCMPRYGRQRLAEQADAFAVLESLSQLGFHFNWLYLRAELAPRLADSAATEPTVSDASPASLWRLLAEHPDARRRLFPSEHLLVGRLPMRLTLDNLELAGSDPVLGPGARPSVSSSGSDSAAAAPSGVSFRCEHRASLGRHLTVTTYADSEEAAVAHLLHQLRRATAADQQPGDKDDDDDDTFLSLFFPTALSLPRVLNLLQASPQLHNLPLSCNAKLNCKLHAVEHRRCCGDDLAALEQLALASPERAIPDDVTNID